MKKLVSVVMPVYNCDLFLESALLSLQAQTFKNFEVILVIDGATDLSLKIAQSFSAQDGRFKVIDRKINRGIVYSLNEGIGVATGDYIARMDSDDLSHPRRLELQIAHMLSNPDWDFCSTAALLGSRKKGVYKFFGSAVDRVVTRSDLIDFGNMIVHGAIMAKSEVMKRNPYNFKFEGCEDYELWLRLVMNYRLGVLAAPLYFYRENDGGILAKNRARTLYMTSFLRDHYASQFSVPETPYINGIGPIDWSAVSLELSSISIILQQVENGYYSSDTPRVSWERLGRFMRNFHIPFWALRNGFAKIRKNMPLVRYMPYRSEFCEGELWLAKI